MGAWGGPLKDSYVRHENFPCTRSMDDMTPYESMLIAGFKRPREEDVAPEQLDGAPAEPEEALAAEPLTADGAAPADEALSTAHVAAAGSEGVEAHAVAPVPAALTAEAAEEAALQHEAAWLRSQIPALQAQLAGLQQQHQALSAAAGASAHAHAAHQPVPALVPAVRHNAAWTLQTNPENGMTYYWNSATSESTYTRPPDFNPEAGLASNADLPQTKGPNGANLFVVRKMRRGEYDEFNDADLRREFDKFGTVTRAEMTIDKETGWCKGYGAHVSRAAHRAPRALPHCTRQPAHCPASLVPRRRRFRELCHCGGGGRGHERDEWLLGRRTRDEGGEEPFVIDENSAR